MKTITFIRSKENTPTEVCSIEESFEYKLSENYCKTATIIYYDTFIIDTEASIINMDWCIIRNPYDGEEYTEQCKKVYIENSRNIFYGMEGTRCLLIDAVKIISTTNNSLEEVKQIIITEEMIEEYNSQPSRFMEEDLSE